jgi:hypothetical protein
MEFQPCGVAVNMRVMMSLDRKSPAMTAMTRESGQVVQTIYEQGALVKVGGSLQSGGRAGIHAIPSSGDGFRLAQVILEAPDVDGPVIVDALHMVGLEMEYDEVP